MTSLSGRSTAMARGANLQEISQILASSGFTTLRADGMAELAAASNAPSAPATLGNIPVTVAQPSRKEQPAAIGVSPDLPLVEIAEQDMSKCTNCKTCYQQVSELFEKTKIVVDGTTKEVSRVIPGVFDKVAITPDLISRASRVADDCDVEIIQFHQPG